MNKTIKKIEEYKEKWLTKALNEAQEKYNEAEDWFRDTGDGRRFRTMSRCEKELHELESYRCYGTTHPPKMPSTLSVEQYKEYCEMKLDLKNLRSKFFYLNAELNLPWMTQTQAIADILDKYKYIPQEIEEKVEAWKNA